MPSDQIAQRVPILDRTLERLPRVGTIYGFDKLGRDAVFLESVNVCTRKSWKRIVIVVAGNCYDFGFIRDFVGIIKRGKATALINVWA